MNDVIKLNNHRLLCGDATNKEDVALLLDGAKVDLLLTDPPYGINIVNPVGGGQIGGQGGASLRPFRNTHTHTHQMAQSEERNHQPSRGTVGTPAVPGFKKGGGKSVKLESPGVVEPRLYKPVIGDDKPFDPQHLLDLDCPAIIFGANNFSSKLPDMSKWIVWYKKPSLESKHNNFSDCELAWTNLKGKAVLCYHHTWSGMVRQGERKLELIERVHPTQKPVGLLKRLIEEYCPPNGVVLDLYGGSGSTLIACAETGRTCYMMELSEDYVEIIQERYWEYIDKSQTKLDNFSKSYHISVKDGVVKKDERRKKG